MLHNVVRYDTHLPKSRAQVRIIRGVEEVAVGRMGSVVYDPIVVERPLSGCSAAV